MHIGVELYTKRQGKHCLCGNLTEVLVRPGSVGIAVVDMGVSMAGSHLDGVTVASLLYSTLSFGWGALERRAIKISLGDAPIMEKGLHAYQGGVMGWVIHLE